MSRTLKVLSLTVLFVGFATIGLATSHEEPEGRIYVWINELKAKPGQGDALVQLLKKQLEKRQMSKKRFLVVTLKHLLKWDC